jgi:renalase
MGPGPAGGGERMNEATIDVAIVGAGIAGLTLARALAARGEPPVVLERSRGIGGRCATRRLDDGQPVDHGVGYLHGRSERFCAELAALGAEPGIVSWPRSRSGRGLPCQPEAFEEGVFRFAPSAGVNRLAKHLARGLDVRLESEVVSLQLDSGQRWTLALGSGGTIRARTLVLAQPIPSARRLLEDIEDVPAGVASLFPLLDLVLTLPCLAVIARYGESVAPPAWDVSLPESSASIHTILHDSSKRPGQRRLVLVVQARPGYSRQHIGQPAADWTRALLDEAASLHGAWVREPEHVQSHAWHHARVDAPSRLAAPILARLSGGAVLALAGDAFHAAGGVEGAYLSGLALADRLAGGGPETNPL